MNMNPEISCSSDRIELFLRNNIQYLNRLKGSRYGRILFHAHPRLRKLYAAYRKVLSPEEKNIACAKVLNAYEERFLWKAKAWSDCFLEDLRVFFRQSGHRLTIDRSGKKVRDYYSVAVIVKNEGRYIREFLLFCQATGASRVYLYDNDSEDDLLEKIGPFVDSGFVVYRKWPGRTVQTAAYRDAIRRARGRTRWLALIDADEYLFSPKGKVSDLLKAYESFPGIGVNWLVFGPGGHKKRPSGLIMNNYTERIADPCSMMNCHIKSIVQPDKVCCMYHTHYAIYKGREYAVDECGEVIGNTYSFLEKTGRVFTGINHHDVFRINHYLTKSYEDLREKCARGYPDGSPNAVFEKQLQIFDTALARDDTIRPYAAQVSGSALLQDQVIQPDSTPEAGAPDHII